MVVESGTGFLCVGALPVGLGRQRIPARLLRVLAVRRLAAPGEVVTLDELIVVGWPFDQAHRDSLLNRLRVTITQLRRAGLERMIVTGPRGYFLDPKVPLLLVPALERSPWP